MSAEYVPWNFCAAEFKSASDNLKQRFTMEKTEWTWNQMQTDLQTNFEAETMQYL